MNFLLFSSEAFMPRTKVALASIKKHHPESTIYLEKVETAAVPGQYIEGLAKIHFETLIELLEEKEQTIVSMGADCVLYNPIGSLNLLMANSSIILTPHIIYPPTRDHSQLYRTGYINADFIVVNRKSLPILKWLVQQDFSEKLNEGIFYEQIWLSIVPFIFPDVQILRDLAYNVAYWNIHERPIYFRGKGLRLKGSGDPVKMFHFSGYEIGKPARMSRYNKFEDATGDLLELFQEYDDAVRSYE